MFARTLSIITAASLLAGTALAAPVGTGFTYQGVLADGGAPAAGPHDLRFLLYDAEVGGSQVGGTVTVDDLAVTDGRIATVLDFGAVFDGNARWLEIHVRPGASTGSYSVLSPRQALTAAPYARHAAIASSADAATFATSAGDASALGGQSPSYYLQWSHLAGVPPGLDDGDDDTLASLTCATDEIAKWTGGAWICGADAGAWASTIVVGPVGTDLENGAALRSAVLALPAGVHTRVEIEPGTYDLADQSLEVPMFTVVTGAGTASTAILSSVCGVATVELDSYTGLHGVAVKNSCANGASSSTGIRGDFGNTISDVFVRVEGDANINYAMRVSSAYLVLRNAALRVMNSAGATVYGLTASGSATIDDVDISVAGGTDSTTGLFIGGELDLENVRVTVWGGGTSSRGVHVQAFTPFRVRDVQATVASTSGTAYGIYLQSGNADEVEVANVTATATGLPDQVSYGLYLNRGVPTVVGATLAGDVALFYESADTTGLHIVGSTLDGDEAAIRTYTQYSPYPVTVEHSLLHGAVDVIQITGNPATVRVAGSRLAGGAITGPAGATCAGVWDESYTFYPSTCP
jgi:hypothetical protein